MATIKFLGSKRGWRVYIYSLDGLIMADQTRSIRKIKKILDRFGLDMPKDLA